MHFPALEPATLVFSEFSLARFANLSLLWFALVITSQVNIRGESRRRDDRVTTLLQSVEKQLPFVEEFLLRDDKTLEDFNKFLGQHSEQLNKSVRDFIQERLDDVLKSQQTESQGKHNEL